MEITKLTPSGFCKGVVGAIHIINKALENNNIDSNKTEDKQNEVKVIGIKKK